MRVAVAAVALVVIAGVVFFWPRGRVVDIPDGLTFTPAAATQGPTTAPIALPAEPRVLIFGDSYTAGYGANDPATEGYARVLPSYLPTWNIAVDGVGSTGYLNAGQSQQGTFQQRIESLTYNDEFDMIILQGGSNDQNVENAGLPDAIDATVRSLGDKFPSAQLLMLGPVSVSTNANDNKLFIDRALRRYATINGIQYISPVNLVWFPTGKQSEWINIELGHPNAAGYDHMARELAAVLQDRISVS